VDLCFFCVFSIAWPCFFSMISVLFSLFHFICDFCFLFIFSFHLCLDLVGWIGETGSGWLVGLERLDLVGWVRETGSGWLLCSDRVILHERRWEKEYR
jgi:hypothetical protein